MPKWSDSVFRQRALAIVVAFGAASYAGCAHPPQAKAPEQESVGYAIPVLEPVTTGSETQQKGQVILQAVPVVMTPTPRPVRRCKYVGQSNLLANMAKPAGEETTSEYEVRVSRAYDVPDKLTFGIKVTNRTGQILKLESSVVRLNVNDKDVEVSNKDLSQGILTPGEQKEYEISTPSWHDFPANSTVHFGIYGVPTDLDATGAVAKRESFEWAFKFTLQQKSEQVQVPVSVESLTPSQVGACN